MEKELSQKNGELAVEKEKKIFELHGQIKRFKDIIENRDKKISYM